MVRQKTTSIVTNSFIEQLLNLGQIQYNITNDNRCHKNAVYYHTQQYYCTTCTEKLMKRQLTKRKLLSEPSPERFIVLLIPRASL